MCSSDVTLDTADTSVHPNSKGSDTAASGKSTPTNPLQEDQKGVDTGSNQADASGSGGGGAKHDKLAPPAQLNPPGTHSPQHPFGLLTLVCRCSVHSVWDVRDSFTAFHWSSWYVC